MPFQDILENEDVKLDNMFVASLVADILRVRIVKYFYKLELYKKTTYTL